MPMFGMAIVVAAVVKWKDVQKFANRFFFSTLGDWTILMGYAL